MQMIEVNHLQLTSLPLPSPALVIDTRGVEDDNVMERLKIEITDLASEMKLQDIHHWRYLTEFLSFWREEPMTVEEVNALRPHQQNNSHHTHSNGTLQPANGTNAPTTMSGLTGKIDPATLKGYTSPFFLEKADDIAPLTEDRPTEFLQQNIHKIVQEVDRLRNNRHVAVADLEKTMSGRSIKDATVRIFFLADAERPDSLATTAIYAAHLKQFYAHKGHQGQQPLVSTAALCLNNSGEAAPSSDFKELLWDSDAQHEWDHLDALILTEDYRQDAARIAGAIQTYLAELLLYALMIVPPMAVGTVSETTQTAKDSRSTTPSTSTEDGKIDQKGRNVSLPPNTFLVGLATMEHSGRWGRRLLNYRVAEKAIEVIQKGAENERFRAKSIATAWLTNWRASIKEAIPDKVPGNIAALQAIHRAEQVKSSADKVFTLRNFGLNIGKSTIEDLTAYCDNLIKTYKSEQDARTSGKAGTTLQDAVDSIPQIQLHLREWESKDPALRQGTPLVNAQMKAQQVLSDKVFFTGANGALPRARMQLEELSNAIGDFRSQHQQEPVELDKMCKELRTKGENKIEALKQHIQSIPFLATVFRIRGAMAWGTLLFALVLSFIATVIGIAWLRHWITYYNAHGQYLAMPDLTPILNDALFFSASPLAILFWVLLLGIVLSVAFVSGRKLIFEKERSDFRVEALFWLSLIVFAFAGLLLSYSLTTLAGDPTSVALIGWLSFLPPLGAIFFIVALVIALIEIGYFIWWYAHLQEERASIVTELYSDHKENIDVVAHFIADSIALHLLLHAGLTSEKGGPGEYFQRMNHLTTWLKDILQNTQTQQRLARKRLEMSVSETQLGADSSSQDLWLNLGIRREYLDVDTLADGYNHLTGQLEQEMEELKEFAEVLVRVMGEEPVAEIEQEFRSRAPAKGTIEQHNSQILMTTLVAMALRLSINATSIYSMTPLIQQYDSISNSFTSQPAAMKALIENLRKRVRQNMLQPVIEGRVKQREMEKNALATSAFAAWGQTLWEGKDLQLDRALSPEGILPKLVEEDYNAHMVKRLLGLSTSLFGRNTEPGQLGALYVLLPPSPQTHQFINDLNLPKRHIVAFPDVERLLLLYVQYYVGEPFFLPEEPAVLPSSTPANGSKTSEDDQDVTGNDAANSAASAATNSAGAQSSSPADMTVQGPTVVDSTPLIPPNRARGKRGKPSGG